MMGAEIRAYYAPSLELSLEEPGPSDSPCPEVTSTFRSSVDW